jgi:hypothetical protein
MKRCHVMIPPSKDACLKTATHVVEFGDGDKVHVCPSCAVYLNELARTHSTVIKTTPLERVA